VSRIFWTNTKTSLIWSIFQKNTCFFVEELAKNVQYKFHQTAHHFQLRVVELQLRWIWFSPWSTEVSTWWSSPIWAGSALGVRLLWPAIWSHRDGKWKSDNGDLKEELGPFKFTIFLSWLIKLDCLTAKDNCHYYCKTVKLLQTVIKKGKWIENQSKNRS